MSAPLSAHKSWSAFDTLLQWCRGWLRSGPESELQCFADAEVERIAKMSGCLLPSSVRWRRLAPKQPTSCCGV